MLIGYVRYVPMGTEETVQIKTMMDNQVTKLFTEQTGSRTVDLKSRQDMLNFAREGDTVIVDSIQIIARNIGELLDVLKQLEDKNVTFRSIQDEIDTSDEKGRFLLRVLHAMTSLDADSIVTQQRESDAKDYAAKFEEAGKPASKILTPPAAQGKPGQPQQAKPQNQPQPKPQDAPGDKPDGNPEKAE